MRRILHVTLALLAATAFAFAARATFAGQVRVHVGGATGTANTFVPNDVTVNVGDRVMWVWTGGRHSVTSGSPGDCQPDLAFDSGTRTPTTSTHIAYSLIFTSVDPSVDYYCDPHCFDGMTGVVRVVASGAATADFRITEVQPDGDKFEITNVGTAAGDLGRFRIVASPSDTAAVPLTSWPVPAGGRVTVNVGVAGAQVVPTTMFMPTMTTLQDAVGHLALFTPNTVVQSTFEPTQMIDYVQWGSAAGQSRESAAVTAGLWTTGQFLPVTAGQSLQFCGAPSDHGQPFWATAPATFGTVNDCTTPARRTTWKHVKVLYR